MRQMDDLPPPPPHPQSVTAPPPYPHTSSSAVRKSLLSSQGGHDHSQSTHFTTNGPAVGRKIFTADDAGHSGSGGGGNEDGGGWSEGGYRGCGPEGSAGGGVGMSGPGGGGAVPRELVPVVHAAVEHAMASVCEGLIH